MSDHTTPEPSGYTQPMAPYGQPPQHPAQGPVPYGQPQHPGQPPYPPQGYVTAPVPYGAYPPMQVAPKSPGLSLLASFFLPGLGSMINGEAGKGVAILLCWIVSWVLTIVLIGFLGLLGFWIWGMVDGYQGARKWNLAHGIIS
ncbi:hypothetical protein KRR39_14695 [Nocardioides panacis]|uniref:Uncharacterized protein n=1 Tax=Nocardioides panacis TaxID=2849501 RepID=A0A975SVQ6_9ACTN|nr:hypothetical protein [Nocardioides panacis]QWZ06779.1 hypothetical protein KRR39_14695 [Nocardioides panacis]